MERCKWVPRSVAPYLMSEPGKSVLSDDGLTQGGSGEATASGYSLKEDHLEVQWQWQENRMALDIDLAEEDGHWDFN